MRKFIFVTWFLLFSLYGAGLSAQSLKDLFNSQTLKEVANTVISELDIIPKNIAGTWSYTGAAVKLSSESTLAGVASNLAVSGVENKLNEYLSKIGFVEGALIYTFESDSTFTSTFKKMNLKGSYTYSTEDSSIELDYGRNERFKGITLRAEASLSVTNLQLLFNADKILEFISKLTSTTSDTKLKALNTMLSQYKGMMIGFELERVDK